jgi:hypothetical protein
LIDTIVKALERARKEESVDELKGDLPSWYLLQGLRKTTKKLSQNSWSPDRNPNPAPPKYEAGVKTTRPPCSSSLPSVLKVQRERLLKNGIKRVHKEIGCGLDSTEGLSSGMLRHVVSYQLTELLTACHRGDDDNGEE